MSLAELVKILLSKKNKCITKREKVKFVRLALNTLWWILENFTIDLSLEYLQCIQLMHTKNLEEHFDKVAELLRKLLDKITLNEA